MKSLFSNKAKFILLLAGLTFSKSATNGADFDEPDTTGWFVRADAVARFNVKASMHAANPMLPAGYYNDGFVAPDLGGAASGKTWNWGYNAASQLAGGDLATHRYDAVPAVGDRDLNLSNPTLGGEVMGGYQFSGFNVLNRPARIGFELGYGYSRSSQNMDFNAAGMSTYTVDQYSLNGIVPPQAPYAGTAAGPGPLINLNKNDQTFATSPAATVFQGRLETTLQDLRIGPSFDLDVTKRFSVGMSLGYSSVYVDATLKYSETTVFDNPAISALNSGPVTLNSAEWEPGIYAEIRANYQFTRYLGAFVGGDFQYNKALQFGNPSHEVKVDLGSTYAAKAGLMVRF